MNTSRIPHRASSSLTIEALPALVDHAAHYLPVQGPIGVFIHHNTLHAFQHLPFEEAVTQASAVFGTEPYMQESAYRKDFQRGRILEEDIMEVLRREANEEVLPGTLDRRALRKALLVPGLRDVEGQRAEWLLKDGGWLKSFRVDVPLEARDALKKDSPAALWEMCLSRTKGKEGSAARTYARPHAALFAAKHMDLDAIVHPPLINLLGLFVDQGVAHWAMPEREAGLLTMFRTIHTGVLSIDPAGLGGLRSAINAVHGKEAAVIVLHALQQLGVDTNAAADLIMAELLALPGWAGMLGFLVVLGVAPGLVMTWSTPAAEDLAQLLRIFNPFTEH